MIKKIIALKYVHFDGNSVKDSTFNNYGGRGNPFSAIVSDDDDDEGDKTTGQADGQVVPATSDDENDEAARQSGRDGE